jgi:hypothetical protein
LVISSAGVPSKVGKSADMVWVRSMTDRNCRGAASGEVAALAAKAAAPVISPRRDSA